MQIKNRQQFLVIVAAVAVGLYLGDSFVLTPLTNSWKAGQEKIAQLKKDIDQGNMLITRGDSIRDTWDRMKTNTLNSANISLAESDFLKAFDRWAKGSGLNIAANHPQWKQPEDDYSTLECRVEASGSMGALANFLNRVEADHAIHNGEKEHISARIESIEISAKDNSGEQLSLVLQVSGLLLPENPPTP